MKVTNTLGAIAMLAAILVFGCLGEGGGTSPSGPPDPPKKTAADSLADTLTAMTRDFPAAPTVLRLSYEYAEGSFCFKGVCPSYNFMRVLWTPVNGSIGYNLYQSMDLDTGYTKVTSGHLDGTLRYGFVTAKDAEGVWFFKVAAIDDKGVEGEVSEPKAIYYPGH